MKKRLILPALLLITFAAVVLWFARGNSTEPTKTNATPQVTTTKKATDALPRLSLPGSEPITFAAGTKDDSYIWAVVNKVRPVSASSYRPNNLVLPNVLERMDKSADERSIDVRMQSSLEAFMGAAKAQGFSLMVASGFRSYELQKTYYTGYSAQYGESAANKFSAKPGESEHQLGLAVDIAYTDMSKCYLDVCFGETPAGIWLAQHAVNYGFILRYPEDKVSITGYQYEPWHFRYVGKELAMSLQKSGLTLDQAVPYIFPDQR